MKHQWTRIIILFLWITLLPLLAQLESKVLADDLQPDTLSLNKNYQNRLTEYLEYCAENPSGNTYTQITKLELDQVPIHEAGIIDDVQFVNSRRDCSDFRMQSLLRLLYQYSGNPLLSDHLVQEVKACILGFKYWIDEPGVDGMCYWSENHQILFHSAEYIAGQLYPDEIFTNSGLTGREHMAKAKSMILDWMRWRATIGFSEWHSNVYYNEDIAPLINLADFSEDPDLTTRAAMIVDLLLFELVLNTHDGVFGTSHGRSYGKDKMRGQDEDTACIAKLLTGKGVYNSTGNMGAVSLAVSNNYHLPEVLLAIGADTPSELITKQKIGINVEDGPSYGLGYDDFQSGMFWWGMSAYASWHIIELTIRMADTYNLWESEFFSQFKIAKALLPFGILPLIAKALPTMAEGSALSQVNTYTYRTPDYMLSCAQNFNPGYWGAQQHIWQATLDQDAIVFTTHPGGMSDDSMAGPWTGGWMPKAVQNENVLIATYKIPGPTVFLGDFVVKYTHAYFPQHAFDDVKQIGNWIFGSKNGGYIALYSNNPFYWVEEGPLAGSELKADGLGNTWICEMGRQVDYGTFENFIHEIKSATVFVAGTFVYYRSPSQGKIVLNWNCPLQINKNTIHVNNYPRFDNPYCYVPFGSQEIVIEKDNLHLFLDFETGERTAEH